jgi:DNA-binding PadR family transcriptional regulator
MRRPTNALALAVLSVLSEQPMHPYEISTTLRARHKEDSIRINYGSLYAVVESLEQRGLITAVERLREGRRPERTVYRITEAGERALRQWLAELIAEPTNQYTDFEAALSLMPALPPEIVHDLLAQRLTTLEQQAASAARTEGFPRIFTIEGEYQATLRAAEIRFVRGLLDDIANGSFDGLDIWRRFHEVRDAGGNPGEVLQQEFASRMTWTT